MSEPSSERADPKGDGFETRAIHVGQPPDPATGAVVPPITLSSTFAQAEVGGDAPYEYARSANPTRRAYEECVASLEGPLTAWRSRAAWPRRTRCCARSVPGDHVVIPNDAYGGTFRLVSKLLAPMGVEWSAVDLTDLDALARDWADDTRIVWVETPTNPALTIVDIAAVFAVAHARGARVVVDNTFATPYLQRPLELGADAVVHSATKYLGGHSDVIGGFAATNDPELAERVRFLQNAAGAVPSPFDCYLVLRGVKTLACAWSATARTRARWRSCSTAIPRSPACCTPGCRRIPAMQSRPVRCARQSADFGGMVSFLAAGGEDAALAIVARPPVHAGRVARRCRVADRAPGPHDPRVGRRLPARGRPRARAPVGRHRDHRRPRRRPPPGPRLRPLTLPLASI